MTNERRIRPADVEVATWVRETRGPVLAHAASRGWWRRLRQPLVVGSVVGAVAVGGIAYAAVERTRTPEPPPTHRGNATFDIGVPGPQDKWLNVSISYRCKPGEKFVLRDEESKILGGDCDQQSFPDDDDPTKTDPGPGGRARSIPMGDVDGTKLVLTSNLSDIYIVTAEYSPTSAMSWPEDLPPVGSDGKPAWDLPAYRVNEYRVNEYGLTVGQIRMGVPESAYPDLIPVTYEGREAYLLKERSSSARWAIRPSPSRLGTRIADVARGTGRAGLCTDGCTTLTARRSSAGWTWV